MEEVIMKYSRASIKIHNTLILSMDLKGLSYTQQLAKVNLFCKINHNLKLRKRPAETIWETRSNGRWLKHTSIVLVE